LLKARLNIGEGENVRAEWPILIKVPQQREKSKEGGKKETHENESKTLLMKRENVSRVEKERWKCRRHKEQTAELGKEKEESERKSP